MAEEDMSARLKVHMERVHRLYGTDDEGKRGGMEHPHPPMRWLAEE